MNRSAISINSISYNSHLLQHREVTIFAPVYFWFSNLKFHQTSEKKHRQGPVSKGVLWGLNIDQKIEFFIKDFFSKPQEIADLVRFTEEILNGKLHFLFCGLFEIYLETVLICSYFPEAWPGITNLESLIADPSYFKLVYSSL